MPVGGNAATSIALVLHELATNAAKYGALSTAQGSVQIDWSVQGDELRLTWKERDGPPVAGPPSTEGFGSVLARQSIQGQLGGRLLHEWNSTGLTIHLSALVARLST